MSPEPNDLPDFVQEALAADEPAEGAVIAEARAREALQFVEWLPPSDAPSEFDRLMASTDQVPTRYAPFFGRIARLWGIAESEVEQILMLSRDPANWRRPWLPGLSWIDIEGGDPALGSMRQLIRFAPGMRFPKHTHTERETLMVLSGNYVDSSGRTVGPGDVHIMEAGSEHSFLVGTAEPCIAVASHTGPRFTGRVMRTLLKLFGGYRR